MIIGEGLSPKKGASASPPPLPQEGCSSIHHQRHLVYARGGLPAVTMACTSYIFSLFPSSSHHIAATSQQIFIFFSSLFQIRYIITSRSKGALLLVLVVRNKQQKSNEYTRVWNRFLRRRNKNIDPKRSLWGAHTKLPINHCYITLRSLVSSF